MLTAVGGVLMLETLSETEKVVNVSFQTILCSVTYERLSIKKRLTVNNEKSKMKQTNKSAICTLVRC